MLTALTHHRVVAIATGATMLWWTGTGGWAQTRAEARPAARAAPIQSANLTLRQCVVLALQQAYNLKIEAIDEDIAKEQVKAARADYEPVFNASLDYRDTTDPGGQDTRTGEFIGSKTQTYSANTNITGLIPSGGRYTVGATGSDTDGEQGTEPFANTSLQGPFLEFRQPLLKNFAIDDTRLNIRVSLQNLHITSLELRQAMLETVNRVEEAYYGLIAARESVRVQESALQLAEQLATENEKRVGHGDKAPLEAAEARSQASTAKASLQLARRQVLAQQNILKGAMVDDFARWRTVTILPEKEMAPVSGTFDFGTSWKRAMHSRPDLMSIEVQLVQQHLRERRSKNLLLPQFDVTAGVGLAGSDRDYDVAVEQIKDQDAPYFTLGFSLELPLGNRRERANHKIAKAQTRQAEVRLRQFRQTVMIEIDDALNQAKADFERIATTREAREYAELALQNERAKLARGASTNFVVLQLQRNLTGARSDEIQSLSDYNMSLSRLRLAEGASLDEHKVGLIAE